MDDFIRNVNIEIVNPIVLFLFAIALVVFLWGVFEFLLNPTNDEKKSTGQRHMLWGVIGIAIMISVFGILKIIISTFNLDEEIKIDNGVYDIKLDKYEPSIR